MDDQPEYNTDMPVGEILRQAREHYGQTLADVENNLRIRAIQLQAVEESDHERLPGRVYAIGFVRSYSEYLGFDPDKMVELYKRQSDGRRAEPKLDFPVAASDSRLPGPAVIIFSLLLFVLLLGWYFLMSGKGDDESINVVPSVAEAQGQKQIQEQKFSARILAEEPMGPPLPKEVSVEETKQQRGIILNVVENSWVEIEDATGKKLVSQVLREGDQYFVPDRPDLTMSIGNAAGVEIVIDDTTIPPLGRRGQVRRNISLDVETLKALAQ